MNLYIVIKKWNALLALSLVVVFAAFAGVQRYGANVQTGNFQSGTERNGAVLIIDAGHGGEDGGAVAKDGTVEADINLAIALKAEALAKMCGREVVMTRREDVSIHDPSSATLREKKVSDLKNRAAICSQVENGVLLSIHQNSIAGYSSVRGAQVFYNEVSGSREVAESIQALFNAAVNEQPKAAKPIGGDIYLLNNVSCPAVIVECGFLTNEEETKLLCDESYQRLLACIIIAGAQGAAG